MINARSLMFLFDAMGVPPDLQTFDFHKCPALTALPTTLAKCGALVTLRLKRCSALRELPVLASLVRLQTLSASYCTMLSCLPPSLACCASLTMLDLTGCSALERLPSLAALPLLAELLLAGCRALVALPDDLGASADTASDAAASEVPLPKMASLASKLPSMASASGGAALRSIILRDCALLHSLPATLGLCARLEELDCSD